MLVAAIRKGLPVEASLRMWYYVVRPVLEFGAEVAGYSTWREAEFVQNEVGRQILGVSKSCATAAVRGEPGWWTLKARRELIMLKYWGKILKSEDNSLVKNTYRSRREELKQGSWCYYIRELLIGLNLENLWISEEIGMVSKFISLVKQRIRQREWIVWLHEVAET